MNNAAYFHIALVHLPVILCPLGVILLIIAHLRGSLQVAQVGLGVILAAGLIVVPVFLLGEPAEEIVEHIVGISEHAIEEHEEAAELALWLTLAAAVSSALAWITLAVGSTRNRIMLASTCIIATIASVALAYTAHMGGAIRHPEAFPRAEEPHS